MGKALSIEHAIEKTNNERILNEDENGNLIMKKDLTSWERVRIFLNRWWVFALLVLSVCQVVQTAIAVLEYFKAP